MGIAVKKRCPCRKDLIGFGTIGILRPYRDEWNDKAFCPVTTTGKLLGWRQYPFGTSLEQKGWRFNTPAQKD